MTADVHVLVLLKGDDRYVYLFDESSYPELCRAVRADAADPRLNLNWFDADALLRRAGERLAATD